MVVLSRTFLSQASCHSVVLQPHGCVATIMVWALPRSLATTRGIINLFSLPAGTKMFQFPALALRYCVVTVLQTDGLSHSEILGSEIICIYPRLIAAYHVLHRLREPRHPPCALFYFLRISRLIAQTRTRSSYFQLLLLISLTVLLVSICQRPFPLKGMVRSKDLNLDVCRTLYII